MSGTKLISCVSLALLGGLLCCSPARAGFLVGDKTGGNIYQYTDAGAFVGLWAAVTGNPTQIDYNPVDGKVYVNTSTGIKRYSAAGVFEANLGNTATTGMSVDTVTGDIYTAKNVGATATLFKISTPGSTPTESVANTLTTSTTTNNGGSMQNVHSFAGALDVSRQTGETGASGEVGVYDDVSGPDIVAGLSKTGALLDTTNIVRSQTIFGTSTVVNRTFSGGIHTGNLQNNSGNVGDMAFGANDTRLYFTGGSNKLEAVRNGQHGGWFDSGTSPTPAGGGVGAFGTFVDTTTGTYGQVSYNDNDGHVYYVIDDGGSLAEVRKLDDGSPTSTTSPTWTTAFSVDAQIGSGQAWGVAFLPAAPAPEPSTFVLGAMGMIGLAFAARRRRDAATCNNQGNA